MQSGCADISVPAPMHGPRSVEYPVTVKHPAALLTALDRFWNGAVEIANGIVPEARSCCRVVEEAGVWDGGCRPAPPAKGGWRHVRPPLRYHCHHSRDADSEGTAAPPHLFCILLPYPSCYKNHQGLPFRTWGAVLGEITAVGSVLISEIKDATNLKERIVAEICQNWTGELAKHAMVALQLREDQCSRPEIRRVAGGGHDGWAVAG